jgi:hypothetical protein
MPTTLEELQREHEARLSGLLGELRGRGAESDWALVRALVHRAVHVAAEQRTVDFCAVATFLAEMIGHSHGLQHSADPQAAGHRDGLH